MDDPLFLRRPGVHWAVLTLFGFLLLIPVTWIASQLFRWLFWLPKDSSQPRTDVPQADMGKFWEKDERDMEDNGELP